MNIKLLSYNIHKGFNSLGSIFILHQMKELLRESQADILCLQEIVGENQKHASEIDNWPTETQFEFIADTHWEHFSYGKNAIYPDRHHGNAILSKFPIHFSKNTNLTINRWEMRGLLHCQIHPTANKTLHILNVHLDLFHGSRMKQLQQIAAYVNSNISPDHALILAGDFNDWSQRLTGHMRQLLGLDEVFQNLHGQHAKSFPSFLPILRLDRIYFRNVEPMTAHILDHKPWSSLSDHLPISCEFKIT